MENKSTQAAIGKWKYPHNKFCLKKKILFKDTNLLGNVYFTNYIDWYGEAREMFFTEHPDANAFLISNTDLMMVTAALNHRFVRNSYFGDKIRIECTVRDVFKTSFKLILRFFNDANNCLIGEGWQKICFIDRQKQTPLPIPAMIHDLIDSVVEK